MLTDLEKLAGAVLDAGGSEVVYMMSPVAVRWPKLRLLMPVTPSIWLCAALPKGTVAVARAERILLRVWS